MTTQEFTPQVFKTITNLCSIEVMLSDCGDGVYYRYSYGQDEEAEIMESEISYDDEGAYFLDGEDKEYLSEYMRIS